MKTINKCKYTIIFWISRIFSISIFGVCLFSVLNVKHIISEKYFNLLFTIEPILDKTDDFFRHFCDVINVNINIRIHIHRSTLCTFCKNSQSIDLLLIILLLILIIGILIIKKYNKRNKYLLLIGISSIVYVIAYLIFQLPIILALAIITPITLIVIQIINKICPIQKVVMLIPIIGEIFCTRNIVKYIYKNSSEKLKDISLLTVVLIVSNIICFVIPYKTDKDFENRIMNNWTYSIRTYQDKMIISGEKELIIMDKEGNDTHIENYEFEELQDFIINENKNEMYIYSPNKMSLLTFDTTTLNIINKIDFERKNVYPPLEIIINAARICCNDDFSKILVIFERSDISYLVDLSTYKVIQKHYAFLKEDGLIYNKYRTSFLVSFHSYEKFLEEIDIENRKIRKIKADEYQGYLAISEKNKEIYVAFHQQGRIGVYDAQTMKLKRKIKSNYAVKDITYDEELNVLIAPSYFTGYVDIFLMDGSDKLLAREFVGYELREGCFDPQKENLYVCSQTGLYRKKIDIKNLINKIKNKH